MATRSYIVEKIPNQDQYMGIYCHWDGSPDYMLPMLEKNYDTFTKVEELLAMGSASIIRETIEISEFHHRNRGETLQKPVLFNLKGIIREATGSGCEYLYIYIGAGKWVVDKLPN